MSMLCIFFFKQKTAYEMRISDWSSDVCSSDLFAQSGGVAVTDELSEAAALSGAPELSASATARPPASKFERRLSEASLAARRSGEIAARPAARATPPRPDAVLARPDWPAALALNAVDAPPASVAPPRAAAAAPPASEAPPVAAALTAPAPSATTPPAASPVPTAASSEERRGGEECVSPCRSRWSPNH